MRERSVTSRITCAALVGPGECWVTRSVPEEGILRLQICALQHYANRLVVQAEVVDEVAGERRARVSASVGGWKR